MAATHCIRCKAEIDPAFKACPHCGEPVTDFLRRYANEPVDGKYQILERLGTGGMGEVYKVTHTMLGSTRVIKVIRPQISESRDAHDRFLREARAATKVQHPNVATLHDFSALPDGSHYMVWEYIDGENLAQRIRARGSLPPRYAVRLMIEALHGLEAIHRAGIIHRDISPENVMITRDVGNEEHVKIIDMGVAKVEGLTENATVAGVFVGKLRYASPEHLGFLPEGEKIDARADLYSMAMVLYEMLTGRPPFEATSPHEYVMLHSRDVQFKPLDLPADLPGGAQLQAVLKRGLERDRNKRYSSAREFANALAEVERSLPDPTSLRTIALPGPDTDATLHVTPLPQQHSLHRATIRTGIGDAGETIRTPLPAQFDPGPRQPVADPTIVARQESSSAKAIAFVVGIVILAVAAISFVLLQTTSDEDKAAPTSTAVAQTRTVVDRPVPPPAANVDVESPAPVTTTTAAAATTAPAPPVTPPPATTTSAAPPVMTPVTTPAPVQKKPPAPKPRPVETAPEPEVPKPVPAPATSVATYVEGGDSDANDGLIAALKRQLSGVKKISVHANTEMMKPLTDSLKSEVPSVTIADGADVTVDFNGTIERLGRGKKRRSGQASVLKNGRVIFRYEMPAEEYRIGDTPAEAFAKVLADALQ